MDHETQAYIITKTQIHKNLKKSAATLSTAATIKTLIVLPTAQNTKD
jgi:hypothetical protein